ncbi:acyl-CoA dehydrogenase domain-containing protein [Novosphingobium nitrogenifigens DSM 19370]|uniref:Acyl-CoA dehydrogenase domain-containing protein n=1 Tax=Novosphingobium nitrogenifigens DSM 19370 TaxID=983920 RepID=F1Z7E4_9SPHN|nr:acyl-CoA dehydrogenase family protein [Novosphingobium nitrogenifigens]EGD59456.1 acyl-CoA dehydrogenase domain-containing protein [Novosphingobium nitrogenifigens DSM 19370]
MATQAIAAIQPDLSDAALAALTAQLAERAEDYDRAPRFPQENFDLLARKGLIGLTVDPRLGGQGAGFVEALRVLGAVAKGEPSTALILFMTYAFHAAPDRNARWPGSLYEKLAHEAVAGGGLIGTFRVEPELGTPVRGGLPKAIARRVGDGPNASWLLSGEKIYSTGSTGLDWFAVFARTDEPTPRLGLFLVDPRSEGIEIVPEWDHLGMRATVSHKVVFRDTPVPAGHDVDLREPEEWVPRPGTNQTALYWNALALATIYDGVARAARDWLAHYLNHRVPSNLGAALSTLPRVQEKFGEIEGLLHTNRVLITSAAQAIDDGQAPDATEINLVKHLANANAIRAVEIGLELTGNPGISRNNPLERHYRDVLCSRIHSPQADTVLVAAGRRGFSQK